MVKQLITFMIICMCLIITLMVDADDDAPEENTGEENFIEPYEVDDDADRFQHDEKDYYFYQPKLNYYLATQVCIHKFNGRLAWVRSIELAKFLADALSETRLEMDTLWTGGRKNADSDPWQWCSTHTNETISDDITKTIVATDEVEATNRHCLGFGRADHDIPQFRALACSVDRSVLCETREKPPDASGSTHPGWIGLDKFEFKIFRQYVTWNQSNAECANFHNSKLAIVSKFEIAQDLGRYLLIGRPSLENAWIAAKWNDDSYIWMENGLKLNDVVNATSGYPPWKGEKVKKKNGCVLLDRHIADTTLFIEARCERQRAFICYRESTKKSITHFQDVSIGNDGYRLIYNKKSWEDAFTFCDTYHNYQSRLAEIRRPEMLFHLLYIMGDNKTDVQHIWLGGRFDSQTGNSVGKWIWVSDSTPISTSEESGLAWIQNTTFSEAVEEVNICLNMDRENHKTAFHYGAACSEPQSFVCYLPLTELLLLHEDERNGDVHTAPPMIGK